MKLLSLFPIAAFCIAIFADLPAHAFTLHVLHINDMHSRVEPVDAQGATCAPEDDAAGACFGGYARLKTAVERIRAEAAAKGEPVILLSAGDQFQGSLFFSAYKGAAEAEFMNALGFDAMVLGNHEYDLGPEGAAKFLDAIAFPGLFGNADVTEEPLLAKFDSGPAVFDVDGVQVGVIGAVTPDTADISSPGPNVAFAPPASYASRMVADLEARGVSHIIALTHLGAAGDIELARAVDGLDLVVGGHSDTLFSNTDPNAAYPYPLWEKAPGGGSVPVVSAGAYGRYLGHAVVTFDETGAVSEMSGDTVLLDAAFAPDEDIAARIAKMAGPLEELKRREIATLKQPIDASRAACRSGQCEMGTLLADAMLERTARQGVQIAIQNGGGLRAGFDAGPVTMGDVLAVLPFQNTLATFNLTGEHIVTALENGVSGVENGAGRFPQVAGLRFTWDPARPPLQRRVGAVEVREEGRWVPIRRDKVYSVVTNNFLSQGGDGYAVFRDHGARSGDYGAGLEEVLADYLAEHPDYVPYRDGRISRIGG